MRVQRIVRRLGELGIDFAVLLDPPNIAYVSGFGEALAMVINVKSGDTTLVVSRLDYERAKREFERLANSVIGYARVEVPPAKPAERLAVAGSLEKAIEGLVKGSVGSDRPLGFSSVDISSTMRELRAIKDEDEVDVMAKAVEIAERALSMSVNLLHRGTTERRVASYIVQEIINGGAEWVAFEPIVGSGENSAFPHYRFGDRHIVKGDMVVVDIGAKYRGYCSDITRTFVVGRPSEKQRDMYLAVLEAQRAALNAVRPGVRASEVDKAARAVLEEYGYGQFFTHSVGHGLGIEVHEFPRLSPDSDVELRSGMVVTIEPGVYINGFGGVRIEDDVLVTDTGARTLSSFERLLF